MRWNSGFAHDSGCTIDTNRAGRSFGDAGFGGGIYCNQASPTIVRCNITLNRTRGTGGGIYAFSSSLAITDCTISGNSGESGGGGIHCALSSLTITGCLVTGNHTLESSGYRGQGGGFYASESDAMIRNCTFSANCAQIGGAIYVDDQSSISLGETIVWGNCAVGKGAEIYVIGDAVFACCAVNPDGIDGSGEVTFNLENVFVDPLFCRLESCQKTGGDYSLRADSPCAPEHSPGNCELIGALPVDCVGTAVEPTTWGALKHAFRR